MSRRRPSRPRAGRRLATSRRGRRAGRRPGGRRRRRKARDGRTPYLLAAAGRRAPARAARLPAAPDGRRLAPEATSCAQLSGTRAGRLGRPRQLHQAAHRPASSGASCAAPSSSPSSRSRISVLLGLGIALLMRRVVAVGADRHDRRDDARLGDAAAGLVPGLRLDGRRRLRRPELAHRPDPRGRLRQAQLVRRPDPGLDRHHRARGLAGPSRSWRSPSTPACPRCRGSCIEAATVDGANAWQVFRAVTLPILRPLHRHRHHAVGDLELPGLHPGLGAAVRQAGAGLPDAGHVRVHARPSRTASTASARPSRSSPCC